jgi:hypothetical protein
MTPDSSYSFTRSGPNAVTSSTGHTIETLGRAGIRVGLEHGAIEVDSEMLHSPMSLVIYRNSIPTTLGVHADVPLDEIVQGLRWAGFTVELI